MLPPPRTVRPARNAAKRVSGTHSTPSQNVKRQLPSGATGSVLAAVAGNNTAVKGKARMQNAKTVEKVSQP